MKNIMVAAMEDVDLDREPGRREDRVPGHVGDVGVTAGLAPIDDERAGGKVAQDTVKKAHGHNTPLRRRPAK